MNSNEASITSLRSEDALLLRLTRIQMLKSDIIESAATLEGQRRSLDWGHFLYQGAIHRVLPLVARNLYDHGLRKSDHEPLDSIPNSVFEVLFSAYIGNKLRNEKLLAEFSRVLQHVAPKVPVVVRKGGVLLENLYGDIGVRRMTDLDLLVSKKDVPNITNALLDMGYVQGRSVDNGQRIQPFDKRTQAFWAVYSNNLLPFVKLDDDPMVRSYNIDVCLNLFLPGSGFDYPTDELLNRSQAVNVGRTQTRMLAPEDMLLDLCAHTYKEATTAWWAQINSDLNLIKFCDIAEYIRSTHDTTFEWEYFSSRIQMFSLQKPVFYSMFFTDLLYPNVISADLLSELRPDDTAFLDHYAISRTGNHKVWKQGFLSRLFDDARLKTTEFVDVPHPL